MAVDSQIPQEAGAKGRVKCTPLQGTEYANKCTPKPKYNNLEEWFQDVSRVGSFIPFGPSETRVSFPRPVVVPCLRCMLIIELFSFFFVEF